MTLTLLVHLAKPILSKENNLNKELKGMALAKNLSIGGVEECSIRLFENVKIGSRLLNHLECLYLIQ